MIYRKLKRTWSHGYLNYMPDFKKVFPELKNVSSEELCDRFIELGLDFYCEGQEKVKVWVRFTLPFALILFFLMVVSTPLVFILTGQWGYPLGKGNTILNWFRALRLLS